MPVISGEEDSAIVSLISCSSWGQWWILTRLDLVAVLGDYLYYEGGEVSQYILGEEDTVGSRTRKFPGFLDDCQSCAKLY
jgi:hypothetical protein